MFYLPEQVEVRDNSEGKARIAPILIKFIIVKHLTIPTLYIVRNYQVTQTVHYPLPNFTKATFKCSTFLSNKNSDLKTIL